MSFHPIYNHNSKILILGTYPSPKSREQGFYYGHPQNRFWAVLSTLLNTNKPESINDKKEMLLEHHIALWDVLESCSITGASDSSIKDPVVNNIGHILTKCNINAIFCNGAKSFELYNKFCYPNTNIQSVKLPSTSPANASYSLYKLVDEWSQILEFTR